VTAALASRLDNARLLVPRVRDLDPEAGTAVVPSQTKAGTCGYRTGCARALLSREVADGLQGRFTTCRFHAATMMVMLCRNASVLIGCKATCASICWLWHWLSA
jgi:hypothetical protein